MKKRKSDDRIVFQSFAMIMQFGLNMIVPVCMMSALGIWLDRKFGTSFLTIVLFIVGAVAGGQNIYRTVKGICMEDSHDAGDKTTGKRKAEEALAAGSKDRGNKQND